MLSTYLLKFTTKSLAQIIYQKPEKVMYIRKLYLSCTALQNNICNSMYSMKDSTVWILMEDPDKLVTWEVDFIPPDAYAIVLMEQNFLGCSTAYREFYVMSSSFLKSTLKALKACQLNQSRHGLHVGVHHVDRHRGRSHSVTQLYWRTPFTSHTSPLVICVQSYVTSVPMCDMRVPRNL